MTVSSRQELKRDSQAARRSWDPAGVADCASKAGSLVFLKLMFPDELRGSTGPLVALGALSMVGRAALATRVQREQALGQLRRRTSAVPLRLRRAAVEVARGVPLVAAQGVAWVMSDTRCKMHKRAAWWRGAALAMPDIMCKTYKPLRGGEGLPCPRLTQRKKDVQATTHVAGCA